MLKKPVFPLKMSSTRANIVWAITLQMIEKASGYVILAVMTRVLLKADLGAMFFALSISGLVAIALNFGTDTYLIRRVAGDPDHGIDHLSTVLSIRLVNVLVGYILLNFFTWFLQPSLVPLMLLVSAYDFLEEIYNSFAAFFVAKKRIIYRLVTLGGFKIIGLCIISLVAYLSRELVPVLWAYVLLDAALVFTAFVVTERNFGKIKFHWNFASNLESLRLSLPFFFVNSLTLMHMRFDTIMVGAMLGFQHLANYELGIKLIEVARFVIRPLNNVFLPIFVEYASSGAWTRLRIRFLQLLLFSVLAGLLLMAGVQVFGSQLIEFLFGSNYLESVSPARVLFISVPFLYAGLILNVVANALHIEHKTVAILFIAVIINVGLNFLVIPVHGITGAAWVTVISQVALTTGMLGIVLARLLQAAKTPPDDRSPASFSVEDLA